MTKNRHALFAMGLIFSLGVFAQYEPTTVWPYIYEDFSQGMVIFKDGKANKSSVNIHLNAGELQYLEGDRIMTATLDDVDCAVMNDVKYVVADNKMMQVILENEQHTAFVLNCVLADLDALYSVQGAYGSNTNTQAVRSQVSVDLGGLGVSSHAKLLAEKKEDGGKLITTKEKKYIKVGNTVAPAYQKDIENAFGLSGNQEWKSFLKTEKIKFRKEADLLKVAQYLVK